MTAIEGILTFLIVVVLLAAWTILVNMIARRASYDDGFLAGRLDAVRERKRFEEFKHEKIKKHLAESKNVLRDFIAIDNVVIHQPSGQEFAVQSNVSVTSVPKWLPDNTKAQVVADMLEERKWLK